MKALERIRNSLAKKTATELEAAQKQPPSSRRECPFPHARPAKTTASSLRHLRRHREALAAQGFKIDKRQIELANPQKPRRISRHRENLPRRNPEVKPQVEKES